MLFHLARELFIFLDHFFRDRRNFFLNRLKKCSTVMLRASGLSRRAYSRFHADDGDIGAREALADCRELFQEFPPGDWNLKFISRRLGSSEVELRTKSRTNSGPIGMPLKKTLRAFR
jgi:hypothetical protein